MSAAGGCPPAFSFSIASAGAGAQWWTRRQRAWAHPEARAERRRHIAERLTTTRAAPFVTKCTRGIRAQPVASCFALRVNALHGEAGQELHVVFPQDRDAFSSADP